jgi:hypothetical protein
MGSVGNRIQRALLLRRLARDKRANENERETALRQARALMQKYGISERDMMAEERRMAAENSEEVTELADQNTSQVWRRALINVIEWVYHLVAYHEKDGRRRIYIVGAPEIRAAAATDVKVVGESMQKAIPSYLKDYQKEQFLEVCVLGFNERLRLLYDARARRRGLMIHIPTAPPPPRSERMAEPEAPKGQMVVQSWATRIEKSPTLAPKQPAAATTTRMVPIGPPISPAVFDAGKYAGEQLAVKYFEHRFDDTLALRLRT